MTRRLCLIALIVCGGCADLSQRASRPDSTTFERRCHPVQDYRLPLRAATSGSGEAVATPSQLEEIAHGTRFTVESIHAAHAIDALPLLQDIAASEQPVLEGRELLERRRERLRQELSNRVLLSLLQLGSVLSEIVCEAERADQLADRLEEREEHYARVLTVLAVVTAGVAGLVGGAVAIANESVAEGIVGVVGGVVSTAFGSAALIQHKTLDFKHPRNLLRDIWEGPRTSTLYPPAVWRFLNRPLEEDPRATLRTAIIARWRRDGRLGEPGSKLEAHRTQILFAAGGRYDVEDFRARAQMLDMLEAQIGLMHQYLERLLEEVLARTHAAQAPLAG